MACSVSEFLAFLEFLEFSEFSEFLEFLELGNGVFSFWNWELVFSFGFFCNCEKLLFSVEFVLLQENFKAQGTCTIFRTVLNLPKFECLFKFVCLYNVCLYL